MPKYLYRNPIILNDISNAGVEWEYFQWPLVVIYDHLAMILLAQLHHVTEFTSQIFAFLRPSRCIIIVSIGQIQLLGHAYIPYLDRRKVILSGSVS